MKSIILPFAVFVFQFTQAQLSISEPIMVAAQGTYGNVRPRIVLNEQNLPVVIWCDSDAEKLYCSVMENGTFSEPQQINPEGIGISSFDWYGPDIVSAGNKIAVVMKLEPEMEAHSYVVISEDGGMNWSDTVLVENSLPLMSRMPSVGMDENGNPFVAFLRQDMIGFSEWALAKSIDGGQSFLPAVSASIDFTDEVCDCCPSNTVINGYDVVVLYRNNEDNLRDIRASISDDSGQSFSSQADMDDLDWEINACPSTGPTSFIADGKLFSAWMSDATGDSRIYFSSYDTPSSTFEGSTEVNPSASNITQNFPSLAGDETIKAVVWENLQAAQRDVIFAYSASSVGFETAPGINITVAMNGNQMRPHMVYADDVFHIVFTDNGGSAVQYLTVSLIVGVDENPMTTAALNVFPNPSQDFLELEWNSSSSVKCELQILDFEGKLVLAEVVESIAGENYKAISIKELANGRYTISLNCGDEATTKSFIKQE